MFMYNEANILDPRKGIILMNYFSSADILLPVNCDLQKWAVTACDQYTSQPEYWHSVRHYVGDAPSTLHMFFPEAELSNVNDTLLHTYRNKMLQYMECNILQEYKNCFVYVERTLANGSIRQGIVGKVDLEFYDYDPKTETKIYATEETVLQRVPPRVALRNGAALEFSHTVMFCDDPECTLIESVGSKRDTLRKLYDFDLMCNGGHICGYLLEGIAAEDFSNAIFAYESQKPYLVGDGNHSLVTAKLSYEALKATDPMADWSNHPARFAMVELENIHSPAMVFEPIYRILLCSNPEGFIKEFEKMDDPMGMPITWVVGNQEGTVRIRKDDSKLLIEHLQQILDAWVEQNDGEIDYIHGVDTVRELSHKAGTVGFILPNFNKSILFPYVLSGKVMPRKTFSIGQAKEKRYYLEGRKIK